MDELQELLAAVDELPVPEIKTFDVKGRGRKQCPHCNKIVGVKNKMCICGKPFIKKAKKERPVDPDRAEILSFASSLGFYPDRNYRIVYTPDCTSNPPIKLKDNISEWAEEMFEKGWGHKMILSPECLRYYLREFYSYDSSEYKTLVKEFNCWIEDIKHEEEFET